MYRKGSLYLNLQGSVAFILKNKWVKIAKEICMKKSTVENLTYGMLKCTIK